MGAKTCQASWSSNDILIHLRIHDMWFSVRAPGTPSVHILQQVRCICGTCVLLEDEFAMMLISKFDEDHNDDFDDPSVSTNSGKF